MNKTEFNFSDIETGFVIVREQGLFKRGHARPDLFTQQIEWEWQQVIDVLKKMDIQYGMEIGTYGGGTFYTLCQMSNDNAVLLDLDLHEGQYDNLEYKERGLKSLGKGNQTIHVLNNDSQEQLSFGWAANILGENKLDYLFIDGNHSHDGVKSDFEMYSPLVKDGGIILFHDIVPHVKGANVYDVWIEIKNNYWHKEFIEKPGEQGWAGIGVLKYES